jgi:hypothetical protein
MNVDPRRVLVLAGAMSLPASACSASKASDGFGSGITAAGESGGDGGADGASASGGTGGEPPPEDEDEADFRVPSASGRFVYSASELTDSVAVIDSSNLAIDVVAVGRGPTVVAPLPADADAGAVAVLDQGSNDVAFLSTTSGFATDVFVRDVTPGANALAVTPSGGHVFAYHDVDGEEALGAGSDQEVTVLDVALDVGHAMTVGAHPREIVFTTDGARAFVVTDDGVNVVPMDALDVGKPDVIPVVTDPGVDPAKLEVQVATDQAVALSRVDGETEVVATNLDDGTQYPFDLTAIPTDLDIAKDGTFAILVTPGLTASAFVEIALPVDAGTVPVPQVLDGEYLGLAHLSPAGDTIVLYTTVDPYAGAPLPPREASVDDPQAGGSTGGSGSSAGSSEGSGSGGSTSTSSGSSSSAGSSDGGEPPPDFDPRRRVTIVRRDAGSWVPITLFVDHPVAAVGIAPDGANAMLLHEMEGPENAPWSYTLVDLTKEFPVTKLQTVEAKPGVVLFTPDGGRAVVLLRDDDAGVRRVDLVDLRTFIVEALDLGSPPEGAGYVDATAKIFVSQEHPTGRITFIDPAGNVETVTGYRLNDAVKD